MSVRPSIDLDRVLSSWLEDEATPHSVDYLGEILERTSRMRQRPAWSFPSRWLPYRLAPRPFEVSRTVWLLLLLAMLVSLLVGLLAVGNQRPRPGPYGLGRPGLVALDVDNHIQVMNADGSGQTMITRGAAVDTSPMWSPDGTRLAFWRADGSGRWIIVVSDTSGNVVASIETQSPTPLPLPSDDPRWSALGYALGSPSFLQWSPDSGSLAFSQDVAGQPRVWTVGADGQGLRQIGDPNLVAADPAWSSDGKRIVFHGATEADGARNGLYLMDSDGGNVHQITSVAGKGYSFAYPQWQPGGELIAFIADPSGQMHVFVVKSDGSGELDVSFPSADKSTSDWIQRWSPDGSRIAFQRYTLDRRGAEIAIVNVDGTGLVIPKGQPVTGIGGPLWSPDGQTVAALLYDSSGVSSGLLVLDVSDLRPPTIVPATNNNGGTTWQRLAP